MTPSFGAYLAGSLSLVAMIVSLSFGGYCQRRRIGP
jgi:EamA domain-containing membrane protein RarD